MRLSPRDSRSLHRLLMLASSVLLLSVSCSDREENLDERLRVSAPHFVQSDLVSFESGAPYEHVSVEQKLEIVPQVIRRKGAAFQTATVVAEQRRVQPLTKPRSIPIEVNDFDLDLDLDQASNNAFALSKPTAMAAQAELPSSFSPNAALQTKVEERGTHTLRMSDMAMIFGSISTILGATTLVSGSGEEGPGAFGLTMLGVGVASYTAGGVLAWRERSGASTGPTITLGPGLSIRGSF